MAAPVAAAMALVACQRLAEKVGERPLENDGGSLVSLHGPQGSISRVTDSGTFQMGAGATIPDDFPKAVPIYPNAKPAFAARSIDPRGHATWSVQMETPDSKEQVASYYKSSMGGFTQQTAADMGKSAMQVWQSPQVDVTLIIGGDSPKATSISLNASSK